MKPSSLLFLIAVLAIPVGCSWLIPADKVFYVTVGNEEDHEILESTVRETVDAYGEKINYCGVGRSFEFGELYCVYAGNIVSGGGFSLSNFEYINSENEESGGRVQFQIFYCRNCSFNPQDFNLDQKLMARGLSISN